MSGHGCVILEESVSFQGRKSTTEERTLSAAQAVQLDKKLGGSAVQVSEIALNEMAMLNLTSYRFIIAVDNLPISNKLSLFVPAIDS